MTSVLDGSGEFERAIEDQNGQRRVRHVYFLPRCRDGRRG